MFLLSRAIEATEAFHVTASLDYTMQMIPLIDRLPDLRMPVPKVQQP